MLKYYYCMDLTTKGLWFLEIEPKFSPFHRPYPSWGALPTRNKRTVRENPAEPRRRGWSNLQTSVDRARRQEDIADSSAIGRIKPNPAGEVTTAPASEMSSSTVVMGLLLSRLRAFPIAY